MSIQRVSDQSRISFGTDEVVSRNSVGGSAMNSFSVVLAKTAKKMIADGSSLSDVASKFNMKEADLNTIISADKKPKLACSCEQEVKTASSDDEKSDLDKATEAYNELHGIRDDKQPAPKVKLNKAIMSAVAGNITDVGGPKRRKETQNSIWDPDVNERLSKTPDNGELIRQARAKEDKRKADILASSHKESVDIAALEKTLKGKEGSLYSASAPEAHKYSKKLPANSMSIFDTKEFERLPETTKPVEEKPKTAKAGSNLTNNHASSKDIFNKMFESMTNKVKE